MLYCASGCRNKVEVVNSEDFGWIVSVDFWTFGWLLVKWMNFECGVEVKHAFISIVQPTAFR